MWIVTIDLFSMFFNVHVRHPDFCGAWFWLCLYIHELSKWNNIIEEPCCNHCSQHTVMIYSLTVGITAESFGSIHWRLDVALSTRVYRCLLIAWIIGHPFWDGNSAWSHWFEDVSSDRTGYGQEEVMSQDMMESNMQAVGTSRSS